MTQTANATAPESPNDRATTFQPVQGGQQHYSGEVLLVSAYAILWAILLGWVALVWRKQSAVSARLDELERAIHHADPENARRVAHPQTD